MNIAHTALLPRIAAPLSVSKRQRALTPEQVIALRHAYADGESTTALAGRYGVSRNTAHRVAIGEIYTDVVTPQRLPWVDPTVRYRGTHNEDERRNIGRMLRHHPGKWALVKQNRTKPDPTPYEVFGMDASVIAIGHDQWGLYVRWAPEQPVITAVAG